MKSLNDIIWNKDIDLEEGKDGIGILGVNELAMWDSCGKLKPPTDPPKGLTVHPHGKCPAQP